MSVTYFGHNENGTGYNGVGFTFANDGVNIVYTCPGTGLQNVKELGVRVYTGATAGNVRLAVYTTSFVLVCQGSAEMAVAGVGNNWLSHTSFTDKDGGAISPQLTGGVDYLIYLAGDDGDYAVCWKDEVTNGYTLYGAEKTGGFTTPFQCTSNNNKQFCVRCGVEPAVTGLSIPIVMHAYQNHRQ